MGMVYNPQAMRYEYFPDVAQPMQQPQPTQAQQSKGNNQGIIWVSGEAGAKAWIVPPNQSCLLMDSESNRFYLKSSDQSGMPSMRVFDYTETTQMGNTAQNNNYSEEIAQLKMQIADLNQKIESFSRKEVEHDG